MAEADSKESVPEYSAKWWMTEISQREQELDKKWRTSADRIVNRYLDVRGDDMVSDEAKRYNIFWANVQILKSALYATPPKPMVKRQYGDAKDDVARVAAMILQRILTFGLECDDSDMHTAFALATEDRLIPGLGQVWLRYEVETEEYTVPAIQHPQTGEEIAPAQQAEKISHEEVCTEFVQWRDFLWSASRTWKEVWWVGRRCWMGKKKFVARFGNDKYSQIREKCREDSTNNQLPKGFVKGKVEVFEIWCEETNKVYWLNRHLDENLDEKPDPLKLDDFWPCPMPLRGTNTSNSTIPRPDFTMVQDQYDELDTLNDRIAILTKALRVVGVFDKTAGELKKMLDGAEFAMIPVDNWAAFAENGGLKGQVDWFPVDVIAQVLERLTIQRQAVIAQIYELTSISDIMRGGSNPRETLGAQKMKAQYSSVRLQLTQQDIALFVRQALRIKAEIIAKHFQPATIAKMSQIEFTESAQFAQPAIELLKNYEASEYRIMISEESLSIADYNAERETRTELLTAIGQFLSQSAQMAQGNPQALPYMLRIIAWVVAAFKGADDVETVLDEAIQQASQPQQQQPDPAAQAKAAAEKAKSDAEAAKAQADQAALQAQQAAAQLTAQTTMQKTQMDNQTKMAISEKDNQTAVLIKQMELGLADKKLAVEVTGMQMDVQESDISRAHEAEQAAAGREHAQHLQDTKPTPPKKGP